MCAATGHHDVIDVQVALCARERGHAVVTGVIMMQLRASIRLR